MNNSVYGGMFVDKYFITVKDSETEEEETIQVPESIWEKYNRGDEFNG